MAVILLAVQVVILFLLCLLCLLCLLPLLGFGRVLTFHTFLAGVTGFVTLCLDA